MPSRLRIAFPLALRLTVTVADSPPCSETVEWFLLRTPIEVAEADIAAFAKVYAMNARPVQKDDRRFVLQSV